MVWNTTINKIIRIPNARRGRAFHLIWKHANYLPPLLISVSIFELLNHFVHSELEDENQSPWVNVPGLISTAYNFVNSKAKAAKLSLFLKFNWDELRFACPGTRYLMFLRKPYFESIQIWIFCLYWLWCSHSYIFISY